MNLSEEALHLSQACVPDRRPLREETLNGVAETLQADAERVPRCGSLRAHSPGMQPTEILIALERQTVSRQAVRRHQAGALRRIRSRRSQLS